MSNVVTFAHRTESCGSVVFGRGHPLTVYRDSMADAYLAQESSPVLPVTKTANSRLPHLSDGVVTFAHRTESCGSAVFGRGHQLTIYRDSMADAYLAQESSPVLLVTKETNGVLLYLSE